MNPWHKSHRDRVFRYLNKGDFDSACEAGTIYLNELEREISGETDSNKINHLRLRKDRIEGTFILAISYKTSVLDKPRKWFEGDGWLEHLNE